MLLFDPTNALSAAYNPLLEVRRGDSEVRDVQNIADLLVDPEGALERRNHWEKTSHSFLVGAIPHVLYAERDKTLTGVANFLSDPKRPIETTLRTMMTARHLGDAPHPVVASAARELLNKSENERSGVLSTAMSFLALYRDPVVGKVTSRCDWRINDLVDGKRPVALYLVVPPSDISRTKPLVRLVLNQIGRRLTEELKVRNQRLLLMLDEFPALGRLDFFESALAFMAGYGLKSVLIAQSLNQIEKAYGPNHAILDNCHVRVAFATNDERTARRVSDALGMATELRAMKNYAGHRLSPWLGHLMVSRQETARPLLTPGEVMQLPSSDELVLVSGIDFEFLFEDSFVVVAGVRHPWARRRKIALTELTNEPWVLSPLERTLGQLTVEAFRACGLEHPRMTVVSPTPEVRLSLLATGRFLSVFPTSSLRFPTPRPELKVLPVELPMRRVPNGIITLKNRALSPVAQLFIEHTREVAKPLAKRKW